MKEKQSKNNDLLKYAGLVTQFLVSIALGVYLGLKGDAYFKLTFPLLVWLLPLLIILAVIIKIMIDTGKK